eukprot:1373262-Amphidinium_carterae.1
MNQAALATSTNENQLMPSWLERTIEQMHCVGDAPEVNRAGCSRSVLERQQALEVSSIFCASRYLQAHLASLSFTQAHNEWHPSEVRSGSAHLS